MKPDWMKPKGYLHLTPNLHLYSNWKRYKAMIENPSFVAKYAFYPLIHAVISERKFKRPDPRKHIGSTKSHSHKRIDNGKIEKSAKERPLHYATHFDALIYSYYAHLLNEYYEIELKKNSELDKSIIAYRKIRINIDEDKGKSTIHFAKEVFDEIILRAEYNKSIGVLTFDIKSFFSSLDHSLLKKKWIELVGSKEFEKHHFNVYKACTNFKYILLSNFKNRKKGNSFDERHLSKIRRQYGFKCFFESNSEFRKAIKEGKLSIYNNPFFRKTSLEKKQVGIPQGLPLSAILANLYLIDFDKIIISDFVTSNSCLYRRYSDDLIFICDVENMQRIKESIESLIQDFSLEISKHKTESFVFKYVKYNTSDFKRLECFKLLEDGSLKPNCFLTYLGFEFRGFNTTIKSANLAKYYRRIISAVKRRAKRSLLAKKNNPDRPHAIYLNQIKKLINKPLKIKDSDKAEIKQYARGRYNLVLSDNGLFKVVKKTKLTISKNSNYYGYVQRCVDIFGDDIFLKQIRKRKKVTYDAMKRYLSKYQI